MKVYGDLTSGNCYKVKLLPTQLDCAHQWVQTSALAGQTRTPEFLAMNANGKIPLLELSAGRYLPEMAPGHAALAVMERHLGEHGFFVGERYSIADIGLYAYTHVADEGDFDLTAYPAVRAWLARVVAQPGHVSMAEALAAGAADGR